MATSDGGFWQPKWGMVWLATTTVVRAEKTRLQLKPTDLESKPATLGTTWHDQR